MKLVTTRIGVDDVNAQARLASNEFDSLELYKLHHADFHDRNIRIDDNIYTLGPSLSHAGSHPLNFAESDSSTIGHQVLDDMLAKATLIDLS